MPLLKIKSSILLLRIIISARKSLVSLIKKCKIAKPLVVTAIRLSRNTSTSVIKIVRNWLKPVPVAVLLV